MKSKYHTVNHCGWLKLTDPGIKANPFMFLKYWFNDNGQLLDAKYRREGKGNYWLSWANDVSSMVLNVCRHSRQPNCSIISLACLTIDITIRLRILILDLSELQNRSHGKAHGRRRGCSTLAPGTQPGGWPTGCSHPRRPCVHLRVLWWWDLSGKHHLPSSNKPKCRYRAAAQK